MTDFRVGDLIDFSDDTVAIVEIVEIQHFGCIYKYIVDEDPDPVYNLVSDKVYELSHETLNTYTKLGDKDTHPELFV